MAISPTDAFKLAKGTIVYTVDPVREIPHNNHDFASVCHFEVRAYVVQSSIPANTASGPTAAAYVACVPFNLMEKLSVKAFATLLVIPKRAWIDPHRHKIIDIEPGISADGFSEAAKK